MQINREEIEEEFKIIGKLSKKVHLHEAEVEFVFETFVTFSVWFW
jgi:dsDNA-specific endonuclease/ATPase MutS2